VAEKPLISIVDDDLSVLEGTMDLLNSMGFVARTFQRADDFLNSGQIDSTACLITDVQMPDMTGIELYEHLVGSGTVIPTILITAYPDDTDRARALRAGVLCYLPKPFDQDELLSCVRSALDHHRNSERGRSRS